MGYMLVYKENIQTICSLLSNDMLIGMGFSVLLAEYHVPKLNAETCPLLSVQFSCDLEWNVPNFAVTLRSMKMFLVLMPGREAATRFELSVYKCRPKTFPQPV